MNSYHLKIFEEIRENQNIFLLNGPSISDLEKKITTLKNKKIIYWGVNNIEGIESNILSKINKNIDVYYIESAEECEARIDDVFNFLEREDSKLLIIGANFVNKNEALKTFLPKNSHKILLLEQYSLGNSAICNSLGSMLRMFFNIIYFKKNPWPLFIFGMDGISNKSKIEDSHAYIETYKNKLPRKNVLIDHFGAQKIHSQAIYDDMVRFDSETMPFFHQTHKKIFVKNGFKFFNANSKTNYRSMPIITQDKAINAIIQSTDSGVIKSQYPQYNFEDLVRMHNDMIAFVNKYWFERFVYGSIGDIKNKVSFEKNNQINNDQ